ncbi:uracil-DNA glycosylase [Deinococcus petrolearius]|uniref:Uracil-DNA glycosylase n=1 Tax=Deinococcus petrolearius TaxID=1751295 RepID=A0ABW1DHF5_9DEIO
MTASPSLPELLATNRACVACTLRPGCAGPVPGEWAGSVQGHSGGLLLVGEAPGPEEDRQGRPFVGRAGEGLRTLLAGAGLARAPLFLTTLVKCRPPAHRPPSPAEVQTCAARWLRPQLAALRPHVVLTLGNAATRHLLGTGPGDTGITRLRGRWQRAPLAHGAAALLLPSLHPATAAHDEARLPGGAWDLLAGDLAEAAAVWRGEREARPAAPPAPPSLF